MQNKLRYKFMLGALLAQLIFFGPAPRPAMATDAAPPENPYLVISAVQITGGTGHTQEDFIELYNPTNVPLDLNGYRLVKRTATGVTDTTVQAWSDAKVVLPYHFFLWANSNYSGISATPDATSSVTLADNNGIALRYGANDTGEIIDSVAWGSTSNGFRSVNPANPVANESLVRENLLDGGDSFSIASSSPRNSSAVLELEFEPEPTPDPEAPTELPPVEDPSPDQPETPEVIEDEEDEEVEINIKITELLPNPSGSDSGFEQIELFNDGEEEVNLAGFRLDDVALTDPISSNAYALPATFLAPGSYVAITIPSGKFALNNTSGDVVTLFNPHGEGIDAVVYEDSTPENKSYSYFESGWEWAEPSFGEDNGQPPVVDDDEEEEKDEEQTEDLGDYDNSGLEISEIYADPVGTETEFVEIYNTGEETAQLSVVGIWVGEKHKLLPDVELKPGEYYAVTQTELPAQLRNSGQVIKLVESNTVLSEVTYPLAIDGASFARFEDGFLWTTQVTKGKDNTLKLPEVLKKEAAAVAAKTTTSKTTKTATAKTSAVKATPKPAVAAAKKPAEPSVKAESAGLSIDKPAQPEEQNQSSEQKQKESMGKIIAMGAAAVAAGVIALYKLVFAAGIE